MLRTIAPPVLEPTTQAFLDALAEKGDPPIYKLSVQQARDVLEGAQADPAFLQAADLEHFTIPRGVNVTIVRSRDSHHLQKVPGIVYLHGGGWILGSLQTHERLLRTLAVATGAAVIFVDYSRSPEAQFPLPLEQAYEVFHYFAEHGGKHRIEGTRLSLAGDSAGGNMCASLCLLSIRRKTAMPRSQVLFYPVTSAERNTESYSEFAEGPWLTKKAMEWFWDAYAPIASTRHSMEVSPLMTPPELLSQMPETLVITAECDVLRDEGEEYARRLTAAGVRTVAVRYLATIHDFVMLNALAETAAAKHATQLASEFLRVSLSR